MPDYINKHLARMGLLAERCDPQPVTVRRGRIIYSAGQPITRLLFCDSGLSSTISELPEGEFVEIFATGGPYSIVGVHTLLRPPESLYEYKVRIELKGHWVSREAIHQLMAGDPAINSFYQQMAQRPNQIIGRIAGCRGVHSHLKRLCDTLLALRAVLESDRIAVTRKVLAEMVPTSKTHWYDEVRDKLAGIVTLAPGHVQIHDVRALKAQACGCRGELLAAIAKA